MCMPLQYFGRWWDITHGNKQRKNKQVCVYKSIFATDTHTHNSQPTKQQFLPYVPLDTKIHVKPSV